MFAHVDEKKREFLRAATSHTHTRTNDVLKENITNAMHWRHNRLVGMGAFVRAISAVLLVTSPSLDTNKLCSMIDSKLDANNRTHRSNVRYGRIRTS